LIADIDPPDLETKIAILRKKAELQRFICLITVALYIADNSKHNIRELEGALVRVLAMSSLRGVPLCKSLAEDALRGFARRDNDESITIGTDSEIRPDYYKISVDTFAGSFQR